MVVSQNRGIPIILISWAPKNVPLFVGNRHISSGVYMGGTFSYSPLRTSKFSLLRDLGKPWHCSLFV